MNISFLSLPSTEASSFSHLLDFSAHGIDKIARKPGPFVTLAYCVELHGFPLVVKQTIGSRLENKSLTENLIVSDVAFGDSRFTVLCLFW
jgi:hypothetical protein